MALRTSKGRIPHEPKTGARGKRTSIGRGNVGFSTMNKKTKNSYKKYRGQGK